MLSLLKRQDGHALPEPGSEPEEKLLSTELTAGKQWHFFLSHTQQNGDAKVLARELYHELEKKGYKCWLDVKMTDQDMEAMKDGVLNSECVLAIITGGKEDEKRYFERPMCRQELNWAIEAGTPIVPVVGMLDKPIVGKYIEEGQSKGIDLQKCDFKHVDCSNNTLLQAALQTILVAAAKPGTASFFKAETSHDGAQTAESGATPVAPAPNVTPDPIMEADAPEVNEAKLVSDGVSEKEQGSSDGQERAAENEQAPVVVDVKLNIDDANGHIRVSLGFGTDEGENPKETVPPKAEADAETPLQRLGSWIKATLFVGLLQSVQKPVETKANQPRLGDSPNQEVAQTDPDDQWDA